MSAVFNTTNTTEKCKKLKELCWTRWVERHDAFAVFLDFLIVCIESVDGNHWNRESHGDAYLALQKFSFIVSLHGYYQRSFGYYKALSVQLQGT